MLEEDGKVVKYTQVSLSVHKMKTEVTILPIV